MVEIVATQRGITAGGHHLEHPLGQLENGNVKGSTTQVVDCIDPLGCVIQAIGNGCRRRLVEQAQHIETRQAGGIFRRLTLGVIEIGRDRNDRSHQIATQPRFSACFQGFQNLGGSFHRALDAGMCFQFDHAGCFDKVIRHRFDVGNVLRATPHETLHRNDRVLGVDRLVLLGVIADLGAAINMVTDDGRQQGAPLIVVQANCNTTAHGGDQRVGSTQVDADGELVLVRCCRLSRLGNLKQGHFYSSSDASASSISCKSFSRNISRRTRSVATAKSLS